MSNRIGSVPYRNYERVLKKAGCEIVGDTAVKDGVRMRLPKATRPVHPDGLRRASDTFNIPLKQFANG